MKTRILMLAFLLAVAASCLEENASERPGQNKLNDLPPELVNFFKEDGFDEADIFFDGKIITLQNDMRISLKDAMGWMSGAPKIGKLNQRKHTYTLTAAAAATVRVKFSATFAADANWVAAAREAMTYMNGAPGVAVNFIEVASNQHIQLTINNNLTLPRLAQANLPPNATTPGALLEVDPGNVNGLSAEAASNGVSMHDVRVNIMVHEFGHTIGFRHTDSTDGSHITCSPTSDGQSIMNSTIDVGSPLFRKTFTRGDLVSAQILYPDVNNLIYYPNGFTEFGQQLNVHWHDHLIPSEYVHLKVWQVIYNTEHEELSLVVPNTGSHAFSIGPMMQVFSYTNVTQPDRDTELEFSCIRIELTMPSTGQLLDMTPSFTAHYSEYL